MDPASRYMLSTNCKSQVFMQFVSFINKKRRDPSPSSSLSSIYRIYISSESERTYTRISKCSLSRQKENERGLVVCTYVEKHSHLINKLLLLKQFQIVGMNLLVLNHLKTQPTHITQSHNVFCSLVFHNKQFYQEFYKICGDL